ncbi:Lactoylglutathione lyase [Orchesella cincta]|uniref:Lactoylglutathione lyase n=1 Tax=Orchesella cincta TaxID=48709 RepID=A0A1D2MSZ5_ORCCI|nr:Lactoylglutathione lyase [Orchesella cincta]
MSALSDAEVGKLILPRDKNTAGFKIGCPTMKIKDARVSLDFYCNKLGMSLLKKLDLPEEGLTDYFLGYLEEGEKLADKGSAEGTFRAMTGTRTVDLRHVWDSKETLEMGTAFDNLSIIVPNVYTACERLEQLGVPFLKKPDEGGMTNLAFIKDPDGYSIEIFSVQTIEDHCL